MDFILGGAKMVKRDKRGRVVCRVDGQYSDRVVSFRVTQKEFDIIQRAKKHGHDPRQVLIDQLRSRLEVNNGAKTT
jgi:hypothetical protein